MSALASLDVLIGLITVYLALSVGCSAAVDAIGSLLKKRGLLLEQGLENLFKGQLSADKSFAESFLGHPLLETLYYPKKSGIVWRVIRRILRRSGDKHPPVTVPSKIVGVVVHDLLVRGKKGATISDCIDALPGDESTNRVKGLLASLVRQVENDAEAFKKLVEVQFNAAMTKASERYKSFAQTMTLVVAIVLVAGANADSIAIAQSLAASPAARVAMVSYARQVVVQDDSFLGHAASAAPAPAASAASEMQDEKMDQARKELSKVRATMNLAGLQIGWQALPSNLGGWIEKFFGLLITILAVSLGAPFWFKALQKFMVVRDELAGKKSDSAPVPSDKAGDGILFQVGDPKYARIS